MLIILYGHCSDNSVVLVCTDKNRQLRRQTFQQKVKGPESSKFQFSRRAFKLIPLAMQSISRTIYAINSTRVNRACWKEARVRLEEDSDY
jgi:hypothetical protein